MTTTFRRGRDFRAYVQDSLATREGASAPARDRLALARAWTAGWAARWKTPEGGGFRLFDRGPFVSLLTRLSFRTAPPRPDSDEAATPERAGAEALRARRAEARDRPSRPTPAERGPSPIGFSSEVDAGSRKENASKQESRSFDCFHETIKRSSRDFEASRREIAAVQARLDAQPEKRPAPADATQQWTAELAREYRREFHPVEAARRPAPEPAADKDPAAAKGAAKAFFLAGKAAWTAGRVLEPVARFLSRRSAPILKVAAVGLAILGAAGFLAQWPERGAGGEPSPTASKSSETAAPRSAWLEIQKPLRLYDLTAPQFVREKRVYTARRHSTGGGREDALTFGEFTGDGPFLRLSIYRHGAEKTADAAFFVDMARRAAQLGLGLGRATIAQTQPTRFGDFETAALTMTEGRAARDNCRGFRFSATQLGLSMAGFACGAGDESVGAGELACLIDRLDLVSAGEDRALRDFFAGAQARGPRGCPEAASAPAKNRPGGAKGLQENRASGVF
ncbi:hypothetical protein [Rhodoblastus sp.]|uniref:hypothetical protein n=1 Tax=Rhodoblastus sp. TaxID=1962975 RepID=UPI0035B0F2F9